MAQGRLLKGQSLGAHWATDAKGSGISTYQNWGEIPPRFMLTLMTKVGVGGGGVQCHRSEGVEVGDMQSVI